jgi:PBP1b-binding outer membrane lipoprotein LpoB
MAKKLLEGEKTIKIKTVKETFYKLLSPSSHCNFTFLIKSMKKIFLLVLVIVVFASCQDEQDPFEWNKDRIGMLTKESKVYQLDSLFANDSIVRAPNSDELMSTPDAIEIYEKGGKHLLTLSPYKADSTSVIENVRVRDERFTTAKGININSDFKTINEAYKIGSIDNMINSAVVWVNEENFYFTIKKDLLPSAVKFDIAAPIDKNMIPDSAKPEFVFINW